MRKPCTGTTLAAGSYVVTAVAIDIAGNTSNPSQPATVVINVNPGAAVTVTGISPDTGVSSTGNITNAQKLTFSGTATTSGVVQVYVDGQSIGTVTTGPNGAWSLADNQQLSPGTHTVTATVTNGGNTSALSAPLSVVIDVTTPRAPVLNDVSPDTGASSTDGITNAKNPTFSGTAQPNTIITLYSNGSTQSFGTTTTNASGAWSYTVPNGGWNDGTYSVTATATEIAGNVSQSSQALKVVIDAQTPQQPSINGISPDTGTSGDGITTARNLIFSGTAPAGTTVWVFLSGGFVGTTSAGGNGAWTFNNTAMTLANGTYAITAQDVDIAGNVSNLSQAYNVTVETVQTPTIAGVTLNTNQQSGQQSLNVIGTSAPQTSVQVYLNGAYLGTVNANGQGQWQWTYTYIPSSTTVNNGVYNFSAIGVDQSLNVSAPSPNFQLLVGGALTASTPVYSSGTLSGSATPGSLVTIVDGDIILGVVMANASGNWQFTPTLSSGSHSIMAEASNGGGLTSVLSSALNFNV